MAATGEAAERAARRAQDHPVLDRLARAGLVVYGVVYVLIGWLAAQLALGHSAGSASGAGALEEIAQKPLGSIALWLSAAGLLALTVWQACQAFAGYVDEDGWRRTLARIGATSRAVVFCALAVMAVRTALSDGGSGGSGSGSGGGASAAMMRQPWGPAVVLVAAGVLLVLAGSSAWRGATDRWRKDLEVEGRTGEIGRVVQVLARAGHLSRAVAFGVLAFLVARAALDHDPRQPGLDQAIVRFRDEPLGPALILLIAAGLACYGVFHLVRAAYLRAP